MAASLLLAACGEGSDILGGNRQAIAPQALRAAVTDARVRRFYELRAWQPAWTGERAEQLENALAVSERHALNSVIPMARSGDDEPARREAALSLAAVRYADALANGVVDPKSLWDVYTVPRDRVDVAAGLSQAVESGRIAEWLASLAPKDAEYRALSEAYVDYRARAARTLRITIAPGEAISIGDRDIRVPNIVAVLRAQNYLAAPPPEQEPPQDKARPADPNLYTAEIAAAIRRLQEDYGIEADGVIANDTLEALNTGVSERARILAVNLERRRWLARRPPDDRIDVNTAAALLTYWRGGQPVHSARVVVGQPGWETPQLGAPLRRLIANPPWNVPESIAEAEILPKGAGYMARNNMRFVDGRIVQAPGPDSALGLVKLDLDNPHAIYLHDTPAKALFAEEERHASHGCVRVQGAVGFARQIAAEQGKLSEFDRALASGEESTVQLPRPISVRLLYHTAWLEDGRIVFRPDPYGWDDRLAQTLGLGGQVRRRVQVRVPADIGP